MNALDYQQLPPPAYDFQDKYGLGYDVINPMSSIDSQVEPLENTVENRSNKVFYKALSVLLAIVAPTIFVGGVFGVVALISNPVGIIFSIFGLCVLSVGAGAGAVKSWERSEAVELPPSYDAFMAEEEANYYPPTYTQATGYPA